MRFFFLAAFICLLNYSCNTESSKISTTVSTHAYDSTYREAVFLDSSRAERIAQAFPVIDSMFKAYMEKNHLPGLSYGLVVDGKLVHTTSYGYTDLEKKIPVTSASLFRVASMTKSFTAMAILKLRDEGKLQLDDPIEKYIPEMRDQRYPTMDAQVITVRHLLTHGSGFPEDNPWGDRQLADTDKELVEFLKKKISFSTVPGSAYEYSNLGFALLGKIVTTVSGKPYQQYIRESIWEPLGMKTSEWEYGNIAADKLAHGYRWLNEQWIEEALLHDTPDGSWGAMGSMISSIDEFAKYIAFHLSAWPPSNKAETGPVKRSSVREMHYPWRYNGMNTRFKYPDGRNCAYASAYCYGLGWLQDCEGRVMIAHSGGLPGFGSQWRILPDYGVGIVSFANRTYSPMGYINLHAIDTLIKIAQLKPRRLPASKVFEEKRDELLRVLPSWENAEKNELFAENFFPDYPIDTLKKYAGDLFRKAGRIKGIKDTWVENQLRGRVILEGENIDIGIWFTLSPENPPRIQEYDIWEVKK